MSSYKCEIEYDAATLSRLLQLMQQGLMSFAESFAEQCANSNEPKDGNWATDSKPFRIPVTPVLNDSVGRRCC